jgi:anaerobic selenocysteine-containing dehydrogenase
MCDLWLPVRINGDMAVIQGIMKEMVEREERLPGSVLDRDFIGSTRRGPTSSWTTSAPARWDDLDPRERAQRGQIREAAEIAMGARAIIACWAMGLTQHRNAVATIQEVMNFLLLRGNIGRPGAGPVPGARAQQRAGRPDDGDLGAPDPGVPEQALRGVLGSSPQGAPGAGRRRLH